MIPAGVTVENSVGSDIDDALGDGKPHEFGGFRHAQFFHDALAVLLDGADADLQGVRRLLVGCAFDDQVQDLAFALGNNAQPSRVYAIAAEEQIGKFTPDQLYRSDDSGTTENFTEYLFEASDGTWTDVLGGGSYAGGSTRLADLLAAFPGAVLLRS